jgi:hypothetical protein
MVEKKYESRRYCQATKGDKEDRFKSTTADKIIAVDYSE